MRHLVIGRGGHVRLSPVVVLGIVLALIGVRGARAGTLTVCPSGCQYTTIAAALAAAGNGDTIAIGPGTYVGGFTINVPVRLVGAGQDVTTISGGDSVITIGSAATVTISRVTISDGTATEHGGGIDNEGTLALSKSTVRDNVAGGLFFAGEGGGIFNDAGRLTLAQSTVTHNAATEGGGIRNLAGTVVAINSQITDNFGSGGISLVAQSGFAGGIANAGTLRLVNTPVLGNTADGDDGGAGGISNEPGGVATLINSPVRGNTALGVLFAAFGGGIDNGGNMNLVNSPVADNTASGSSVAFGGGIYNGGPLTLINSPVMANDASGGEVHGGGIFNSPPAPVVLINSPVTGNIPDDCVGC